MVLCRSCHLSHGEAYRLGEILMSSNGGKPKRGGIISYWES